jgi:hypothetical protein
MKGKRNSVNPYGHQLTEPKRSSTNLSKFSPFTKRKDTSDTLSPSAEEPESSAVLSMAREEPGPAVDRVPSPRSDIIESAELGAEATGLTNGTHRETFLEPEISRTVEPAVAPVLTPVLVPAPAPAPALAPLPALPHEEEPNRSTDAITQAMQEASL